MFRVCVEWRGIAWIRSPVRSPPSFTWLIRASWLIWGSTVHQINRITPINHDLFRSGISRHASAPGGAQASPRAKRHRGGDGRPARLGGQVKGGADDAV